MILYSTGCPLCRTLEARMRAAGVSFTKTDDMSDVIEAGFQTAPVLFYKGKYFTFSEAMDMMNSIIKENEQHENQPQTG